VLSDLIRTPDRHSAELTGGALLSLRGVFC
jgi:hypothetical protein